MIPGGRPEECMQQRLAAHWMGPWPRRWRHWCRRRWGGLGPGEASAVTGAVRFCASTQVLHRVGDELAKSLVKVLLQLADRDVPDCRVAPLQQRSCAKTTDEIEE